MAVMTAPAIAWPRKTHDLVNAFVDSTRWDALEFRDDDIVVATYGKSGTTLTQQIVAQLVLNGDPEVYGAAVSPWLEVRVDETVLERARAQTHRRFLKTHLALDELTYSPIAKYIVVGRDARDIIWSWHNHFRGFRQVALPEFQNELPPTVPADVVQFYHAFLDGPGQQTPFWSYVQGWWDARGLPNLLTLHYADLIADLPREISKIATFLDIPVDDARVGVAAAHCSLAHMRKVAANDPILNTVFEHGAETFINKGVNGRWRDLLTRAEIDKCDEIAARELTPDCAAWLRDGTMS